jgi:hypothetical protein
MANVFKGNVPNGANNPSIIRQISDPSPVKNFGPSARQAALIGDANPGSIIELDWTGADFSIVRFTLPTFLFLSVILMRQLACSLLPLLSDPSK